MSTNVYDGQVGSELLVDVDKKAISTSEIDKGSGRIMYTTKFFTCKKVFRLCRMMSKGRSKSIKIVLHYFSFQAEKNEVYVVRLLLGGGCKIYL